MHTILIFQMRSHPPKFSHLFDFWNQLTFVFSVLRVIFITYSKSKFTCLLLSINHPLHYLSLDFFSHICICLKKLTFIFHCPSFYTSTSPKQSPSFFASPPDLRKKEKIRPPDLSYEKMNSFLYPSICPTGHATFMLQ